MEYSIRLQEAYLAGELTSNQLRACTQVVAVQRAMAQPVENKRRLDRIAEIEGIVNKPASKMGLRDVGPPLDGLEGDSTLTTE
jgi:hypothetical protein